MPTSDRLNVVLGAGPVGRSLVETLRAKGQQVRVATRSGRASVGEGVEVVSADVADADAAERACAGASVVYGCVGLDYGNWPERWPPMMRGMLAGAGSANARFVFMDNLYMYGPVNVPMVEDLPLTDYGRKPATRARITRMWREAHTAGRVEAAAVRASDFYGPGVTLAALGEYAFGNIARGRAAQVIGNIDLPHSFTYVPDIARALATVGEAGDGAMGQAWHVPNAPDRTVREILEMFADAVGHELSVRVMPPLLLTLLGIFVSDLREMKEMMYEWDRPFQVDHSKFAARFPDDATPFEDGIARTAEWYKARG